MRKHTFWDVPVDCLSFDFAVVLDELDVRFFQFLIEAQ